MTEDSVFTVQYVHEATWDWNLSDEVLYIAGNPDKPRWAHFNCPCKCSSRLELALQPGFNRRWNFIDGPEGPSLYPSVNVVKGCGAHFFLTSGKVQWCQ